MLIRTLARYSLLAAYTTALPQYSNLELAATSPAPPPLQPTSPVPISPTTPHTIHLYGAPTSPSTPAPTPAKNSTLYEPPTILVITTLTTSIKTTTLPNPTPSPISLHATDSPTDDNNDGDPFDPSLAKWPQWLTAATFTLLFYDVVTLALFLWLWVFGYLWWLRRGVGGGIGMVGVRRGDGGMELVTVRRVGRVEEEELGREMRRVGLI